MLGHLPLSDAPLSDLTGTIDLDVDSFERDWEAAQVDLTFIPRVQRPEFDREFMSVRIRQDDWIESAEFGWENYPPQIEHIYPRAGGVRRIVCGRTAMDRRVRARRPFRRDDVGPDLSG
jgi:hypothetical protein